MSDQKDQTEDVKTPVSENVSDSTSKSQPEVTTPTADESHVEDQQVSSKTQQPEEKSEDVHVKEREEIKMSKLEKERNEALERERTKDVATLRWVVQKGEQDTRDYLTSLGYPTNEIEDAVQNLKRENPTIWSDKQVQSQSIDPNQLREVVGQLPEVQYARTKLEEDKKKEDDFYANFEKNRSDIAKGRTDQEIAQVRSLIGAQAKFYEGSKKLSKEQALDLAYKAVLHPEQLKEEGAFEAQVEGNADNASTLQSPTGQSVKKSNVHLTDLEREIAKKAGMSEEDYAKYKS